jgi:teichuronic acid exporter
VQVVTSSSGAFFQAFGNTRLMFLDGIASTAVMVAAMVVGLRDGSLEQLATAIAVAFHLNAVKTFWLLYRNVFGTSPRPFFVGMALPALLVAILALVAGRLTP